MPHLNDQVAIVAAHKQENVVITAKREREAKTQSAADAAPGYWLHVVSHLDPKYGGLSAVVPQLCSAVTRSKEFSIGLHAFCAPGEEYAPALGPDVTVRYWPQGRAKWLRDRSLAFWFRDAVSRADGVHIHGLWDQSTHVAAATARRLGKPYILSAHGMLESWALAHKKRKKQVYAALIERANIEGAACLHALTQAEAADYRRFGTRRPIAVIPNGVSIPADVTPNAFLELFPALKGKRILLFLGRLHFKKGLELLIRAWAQLSEQWPEARLVLAGPDSQNTLLSIQQLTRDLKIEGQVVFTGMLDGALKWGALAASECFVLPSYSEGLSVSTLEAMGMGLPVIITEQCNLPEVLACGGGWQIQPNVEDLVAAIAAFLHNSPESNRKMGEKGRELIATRYSWPIVGTMMSELYRSVQDGLPVER